MTADGPSMTTAKPPATNRELSAGAALFTLAATMIGSGVLSVPYSLLNSGVVVGTCLVAFNATLSATVGWILCLCAQQVETSPFDAPQYDTIALRLLGTRGHTAVRACQLLNLFSVICMFALVSVDLLYPFVQPQLSRVAVCAIVVASFLPLSLLKTMNALRHSSYLAVAILLYLFVALVVRSLMDDIPPGSGPVALSTTPWGVFIALPIQSTGFGCHVNLVRVHSELRSRQRVLALIVSSFGFGFLFSASFGVLGYLHFRATTCGDVLRSFTDRNDYVLHVARVGLAIVMTCKAPLLNQPLRKVITDTLWPKGVNLFAHTAATMVVFAGVFGCITVVPQLDKAVAILGCTCGAFLNNIFPAIFMWRLGGFRSASQAGAVGETIQWTPVKDSDEAVDEEHQRTHDQKHSLALFSPPVLRGLSVCVLLTGLVFVTVSFAATIAAFNTPVPPNC